MGVDRTLEEFFTNSFQVRQTVRQAQEPLQGAGGGGTSGGMEARIARLESDMEHVKNDVAAIKVDTSAIRESLTVVRVDNASVKERLSHVPTVGKLWAASGSIIAAIGIIVAIAVRFLPHAG
jgi:hypothetical protein